MYLFDTGKLALRPPTDGQQRLFLPERAPRAVPIVGARSSGRRSGWWRSAAPAGLPNAERGGGNTERIWEPCPTPPVPRSAFALPRSADRPPSLSAAQIDAILSSYHSPAAGLGPVFYDQGVAAGIDPAYLVAFFVIESACGTRGVARTTHSLGNIRCTPGYACAAGYRVYPTWADGAHDWFALIRSLYLDTWDLRTPAAILPRYAPPSDDNDPAAYAASVIQLVDGWTR